MEKLTEADLFKLLAATSTGMSVEVFQAEAKKWIAEASTRAGRSRIRILPICQCRKC
jgi:hypothetical protein